MIYYNEYADVPEEDLKEFVSKQQMGRLVTVGSDGQPHIGLYPFLYLGSYIEMHLHRDDEQLHDLIGSSRCVFEIDEILGTIPSYWVHPGNAAFATAYYRCVLFECEGVVSSDERVIAEHQKRLMEHYQPEGGYEPIDPSIAMYQNSLGMIAAVTLQVRVRKVKWKLGQNRDRATRERLVKQLLETRNSEAQKAAEALQWTIDRES